MSCLIIFQKSILCFNSNDLNLCNWYTLENIIQLKVDVETVSKLNVFFEHTFTLPFVKWFLLTWLICIVKLIQEIKWRYVGKMYCRNFSEVMFDKSVESRWNLNKMLYNLSAKWVSVKKYNGHALWFLNWAQLLTKQYSISDFI